MASIAENLALAVEHQRAGRFQLAEQIYNDVLRADPTQADALHMLGILAAETGRPDFAIQTIRRAIELQPHCADFHNNLGEALRSAGRVGEASAAYRQAIALQPDFALAYNNLGNALRAQGSAAQAIACFRKALESRPDFALAHNNLGIALKDAGQLAEASACYRRALEIEPHFAGALNNLANALKEQRNFGEAVHYYQRALQLQPRAADVHYNLANTYKEMGRQAEALAAYERALTLRPDMVQAHLNLAHTLREQGRPSEALRALEQALKLQPGSADAYTSLGEIYKDLGRLKEALAAFRHALELNPDSLDAHSSLVFSLHFLPDYDARMLYEEHRRWNERHAGPRLRESKPHTNDRTPGRKLRVGYVSADFNFHPVGWFLLPLLEAHDHSKIDVCCYSTVRRPDHNTDLFRARADLWRDLAEVADEEADRLIRGDGIDILVDLGLFTAGNRLTLFACKPAPVQVTYLAYAGTSGVDAIDYRFTDSYIDPPGQDDSVYSEESIRLPQTYWCYRPPVEPSSRTETPARSAGTVTFGCLNNFCKINEAVLGLWSRILQSVADSRLLLHSPVGDHRIQIRAFFLSRGVGEHRIGFVEKVPISDYFKLYDRIDVALDPFPFGGGTTTCDALWMGVPVVTLRGKTAVGRVGVSVLSNVGLPEFIARDADEYVRIAIETAQDLTRLNTLRSGLRAKMKASPLMDAPRLARAIESAYRTMWQRWCNN